MGKGDKRRPQSEVFNDNWDRIFNKRKKKSKKVDTSDAESFHIKNARHLKMKDIAYKEKQAEEQRKRDQEIFDRLDREVEEENKDS